MEIPKQLKDNVYDLLQEPTLDKFRDFLKNHMGEHNSIDFKSDWVEGSHLAKLMLSMANSSGGIVVFGISESDDKSVNPKGLDKLNDHATISNGIKNFISSDLKYEIYDFSYTASEYSALEGKHFQMLVVEDTPAFIPFLAKKDSGNLKSNEIYVRRGTSCEVADQNEINALIKKRINYTHPLKGTPLQLEEHLKQLKILYDNIDKNHVSFKIDTSDGILGFFKDIYNAITGGNKTVVPNPLYPDEDYEEFISRMITEKKNKIERVLDLY